VKKKIINGKRSRSFAHFFNKNIDLWCFLLEREYEKMEASQYRSCLFARNLIEAFLYVIAVRTALVRRFTRGSMLPIS